MAEPVEKVVNKALALPAEVRAVFVDKLETVS